MNLQEIFIEIDALSPEDRDTLYDVLHRQRIIQRESEILANRAQAHRSIIDGTIRHGTARDLIAELVQNDKEFKQAANYVLEKNAELYRRLG